jgi:DNA gyrase subunit A
MQTSGLYRLSDSQAQEILQMRLQRLTGLEQDKIVNEYKEVMAEISDLLDLLSKPERVTQVIEAELKEVQAEFGIAGGDSGRRSFIEMNATELFTEDLITPQDMVVTLSNTGYMKSQPLSEYRAQKRGGRGKQAAATKNEDWIETLFVANTHDIILCFSDRGRMYWLKVWEVPQGSRNARGKPIVNMFPLIEGEKITVILPIKGYQDDQYVFMATSLGTVKKTRLSDFSNPRKAGIIAVDLNENDFLVGAAITDGQHDVMLFSDAGKAVRFDENDVRPMGRTARGVRGMNLGAGHQVIAMLVAPAEAAEGAEAAVVDENGLAIPSSVLTATENGFGKRTPIGEYTRHGRGTKGMIAIQTTERNGKVVAASLVSPEDQIMLITTGGILVRTRVSEIREMGRATQGVTLINVDEGTRLSGLQRIAESDSDDENDFDEGEEGEGGDISADPAVDSSSNEAGDA